MSVTLTVKHADTGAEGGTAALCLSATSQPVTGLELVQHVLSTVGGESDLRTVSPSVCLSQCLSVCVSVSVFVCLSQCLSVCLFTVHGIIMQQAASQLLHVSLNLC